MSRMISGIGAFIVIANVGVLFAESTNAFQAIAETPRVDWQENYACATSVAKAQGKMLCVYLNRDGKASKSHESVFERADVIDRLDKDFVAVRAKLNETFEGKDGRVRLSSQPGFKDLNGSPGIVVIDYRNPKSKHFGRAVSVLPFASGKYYQFRPAHVPVVLDLPQGTLTQRTMVFAVRIHPERPKSASSNAKIDPNLLKGAQDHSQHQASITLQGHHNWENRFASLSSKLPGGLHAQEVVAESWPNETLVDAACDCVSSWRQSSGHWSAVRSHQSRFAFDMKRGRNGIWYATGLFGNRR